MDSFQLEDYSEEGTVSLKYLKEVFVTLDIKLEPEVMDYLLFCVFSKSESTLRMKYQLIFDLAEGRFPQTHMSCSSEGANGGLRKRPESSSPSKIKARNQNKFSHEQ